MRMELKITGEADDPRAVAQAAIDAAAWAGMERGRANVSYGNSQGVSILPEEGEQEQASVMAVSFASSKGAALADELNVPASAFEGAVPSGKRGFSVGDVRRIAGG
jgi:hypothetical protein